MECAGGSTKTDRRRSEERKEVFRELRLACKRFEEMEAQKNAHTFVTSRNWPGRTHYFPGGYLGFMVSSRDMWIYTKGWGLCLNLADQATVQWKDSLGWHKHEIPPPPREEGTFGVTGRRRSLL